MSQTLTVTAQPHLAGPHVLTLSGELDYHTSARLREALNEIPLETGTGLVIDLSGLTYCDSTGITLLVTAYQRAQATGAQLSLAGSSPDLLRVFRIVGLDQVFVLQPTTEEAINALRS
ncbi:Anti-sigma-B factor antagonist [Streptomyces sp. ADI96-02]|uniref:STAS domain-containing protein n=1 Tax=unclassified Streptomyces TaxID=2593676 RepID=UPI000F968261|nr:STAS domain-containing protein [Streptomyces sp. ADI96-02]RPK56818.1 Anti-sigma-B factor antagonist [Streptomyces sp. ADI96-02]